MENLGSFLATLQISDLLDILIVTGLIFTVLRIVRETRSYTAMRGLIGIVLFGILIYVIARALNLITTVRIFERLWVVIVLVFLIVFQNDFRRALTELGQMRFFRRFFLSTGVDIEELLKAVRTFSRQKIGALICIERRNPLSGYTISGTEIDAVITSELLRTIFMTYSPLHDGAVIIRGDRILAAGCILPIIPAEASPLKDVGTRHHAALAMSQENDSVVVVVSEETGTISLAVGGKLERHHTQETLKEALEGLIDVKREEELPQD